LSVDDELSYLQEFEHITLARVLMAHSKRERPPVELDAFLERLRRAAQDGSRTGSVIEILVLQALSQQATGETTAALAALQQALALAAPEGYVRIFVDEGEPMGSLLRRAATGGGATAYINRLLAALDKSGRTPGADRPAKQALIDPLSARELDVLRLLGTDLDGPDIARKLFLSLNTVRTHTKNIYAKLGVNNRREAVRRGSELELMRRPDGR